MATVESTVYLGQMCSDNPLRLPHIQADPIRLRKYALAQDASRSNPRFDNLVLPDWILSGTCTCKPRFIGAQWFTVSHFSIKISGREKDVLVCTTCNKLFPSFVHAFITECESCDDFFVNFPPNNYDLCKGCN